VFELDNKLHDEASNVTAEAGQVLVDGPDGVAVSLTPEAAAETSDRLLDSAAEAQGQIIAETRAAKDQATHKSS
jgi:hypothetical protein